MISTYKLQVKDVAKPIIIMVIFLGIKIKIVGIIISLDFIVVSFVVVVAQIFHYQTNYGKEKKKRWKELTDDSQTNCRKEEMEITER